MDTPVIIAALATIVGFSVLAFGVVVVVIIEVVAQWRRERKWRRLDATKTPPIDEAV
jgi:hypothetical protein